MEKGWKGLAITSCDYLTFNIPFTRLIGHRSSPESCFGQHGCAVCPESNGKISAANLQSGILSLCRCAPRELLVTARMRGMSRSNGNISGNSLRPWIVDPWLNAAAIWWGEILPSPIISKHESLSTAARLPAVQTGE